MLCYKYMSWCHWLDTMLMCRIKASKPSEFNDPFDCVGAISGQLPKDAEDKYIDQCYQKYAPAMGKEMEEEFKNTFASVYKSLVERCFYNKQHLDEVCRIVSLSDASRISHRDDLLMWSHYADCAKGVRIAIDMPRSCDYYALEHVHYAEEIPVYDITNADVLFGGPRWEKAYRQFVCTKSMAWSYETEVRLVLHRPASDAHLIKVKGMDFFHLKRGWIKEVAFGSEVDMEVACHYASILKLAGFASVNFIKAFRDGRRYNLGYASL